MKERLLVILLIGISALNFVPADFSLGDISYSIDSQYGPSGSVRGWLNISFSNESSNSLFSASFGNSITLIDLLRTDSNYDYSCTTDNCTFDYSASNGTPTKSFNLGVGDSKILGIQFKEDIIAINSVDFIVESTAEQSCFNQLTMDFLKDGSNDFGNTKSIVGDCAFTKSYGCFDAEASANDYIIGKFPSKHCQRINLSESPGFKLGAWIKRNGGNRDLTMALYNLYGSAISGAHCILPNVSEGEVSCEVSHLVPESAEYYVCIYSEEQGTSEIRGYSMIDGCGFYGVNVLDENAAFQIFAEGRKFDDIEILNITNSLPHGNTLGGEAEDYLIETYGSLGCSTGCIIPLKFISQKLQDITLKDLKVKYETNLGPTTLTTFYELEESPPKISSDLQKLSIDGGEFLLPSGYGETVFKLEFNEEEILSKKVSIEEVPKINYITPRKTASAYPTTFKAKISSSSNITEYKWRFGDGEIKTTDTNTVIHTYGSIGDYLLKLTVTDSVQRESSKTFEINVESPDEIINKTLIEMQGDLIKINTQLEKFLSFEGKGLNEVLELDLMNDKLKQSQRDYKSAVSDQDFNNVMTKILEIKIPKSIIISKSSEFLVFYPDEKNIDLQILSEISKEDYDASKEDSFIEGVFAWHHENLDVKIKFLEMSSKYEHYSEPVLRSFELVIKKKDPGVKDAYIILKQLDNLKFKENYLEESESGYVYIDLSSEEKSLAFSTTEEVDVTDLALFISPEISRLPLIELPEQEEEKKKWGLFIAIIVFLLIIGLVVYVGLQEWYKRRYENYLFKNRNDLYNIVAFIQNSRNKKVEDPKIALKLRKAGWASEQVNYAMKKYVGKRTGMLEIPIDWILKFFKKKKPSKIDAKKRMLSTSPMGKFQKR